MNALTFFIFFVTLLVIILLIVNQLISVHKPNAEKVSTYECGFTGIGDTRQRFSVQFFLVAILFLIMDLEVILLFPFAVAIYQISVYGFWIMVIFVLILTVGLVFELGSGALYFTSKASSNHSASNSSNPHVRVPPLLWAGLKDGLLFYLVIISYVVLQLFYIVDGYIDPAQLDGCSSYEESSVNEKDFVMINYLAQILRTFFFFFMFYAFLILLSVLSRLGLFFDFTDLFDLVLITSYVPVKLYSNMDVMKKQIISENKGKSGVYKITNNINGKCYVGSSSLLTSRFYAYFSAQYLITATAASNSIIARALLKYGYSAFSLEILEYCDSNLVVEREQYYLDLLNPAYNLSPTAGSNKGYTHTAESRARMSAAKKGENNPMFGRTLEVPGRAMTIYVYSLDMQLLHTFPSQTAAAKFLGVSQRYVCELLQEGKPFRGKYIIRNSSC